MTLVQVHLKMWILDDGAVLPFGVGDRVAWGLGIALEQRPLVVDEEGADGITTPPPANESRCRARADVTGRATVVFDGDDVPLAALVSPFVGLTLVIIGPGSTDAEWDGCRVVVRGDVVVEPYLWEEGGLVRGAVPDGLTTALVERVRVLRSGTDELTRTIGAGNAWNDIAVVEPHRGDRSDYLVDLRILPR